MTTRINPHRPAVPAARRSKPENKAVGSKRGGTASQAESKYIEKDARQVFNGPRAYKMRRYQGKILRFADCSKGLRMDRRRQGVPTQIRGVLTLTGQKPKEMTWGAHGQKSGEIVSIVGAPGACTLDIQGLW